MTRFSITQLNNHKQNRYKINVGLSLVLNKGDKMKALTAEQMRKLDAFTIERRAIPALLLMEHAAMAVWQEIKEKEKSAQQILIVCGAGNNGGDGLALARLLMQDNYEVSIVLLADTKKFSVLARQQYQILLNLKARIIELTEAKDFEKLDNNWDIIIDAIFGVSLNREVKGIYADAISYINNNKAKVIAIDLPSGVDASTGKILGTAVKADKTITFAETKIGLHLYPAANYCGQIIIADIGIDNNALPTLMQKQDFGDVIEIITDNCLEKLAKRKANSHKGTYGSALIIAGGKDMAGAAMLASKAAYKTGVGLTRIITDESNKTAVNCFLPEAICYTHNTKTTDKNLRKLFEKEINKATAILIGCGLGTDDRAKQLLELAIASDLPLVIDADGLNLLAENPFMLDELKLRENATILTPHIKEMTRLAKINKEELLEKQIEIAKNFAMERNIFLVLKNARTIVASSTGKTYLNIKGNNGMATGGSGDVLAGIITGLISNTENDKLNAAIAGVYLHASAGDKAAEKQGAHALLASDIIDSIATILK